MSSKKLQSHSSIPRSWNQKWKPFNNISSRNAISWLKGSSWSLQGIKNVDWMQWDFMLQPRMRHSISGLIVLVIPATETESSVAFAGGNSYRISVLWSLFDRESHCRARSTRTPYSFPLICPRLLTFFKVSSLILILRIVVTWVILLVTISFGTPHIPRFFPSHVHSLSFGPALEELKRGLEGIERVLIKYGVSRAPGA